jgi:hypothetical protein
MRIVKSAVSSLLFAANHDFDFGHDARSSTSGAYEVLLTFAFGSPTQRKAPAQLD